MSYEGYYEYVCRNGHLTHINCYDDHDNYEVCDKCGADIIYRRTVDQTNGFDKKAYPDLDVKKQKTCPSCGCVEETIYHLPKHKKGFGNWHRVKQ